MVKRKFKLENKHVVLGFTFVFILVSIVGYIRRLTLENNKLYTTCRVYEIKDTQRGKQSITIAKIEYYIQGVRYSTYYDQNYYEIGECYNMIYSSSNFKNINVFFDKVVDCSE